MKAGILCGCYPTILKSCVVIALLLLLPPHSARAQANMRREGALTLNQTSDDSHGFYAATIDPANGFAYFAAKYVYKINLATPLPTQVGAGVSIGKAYSGAMDSPAGCAYFVVGSSIYQILANGTNAPSLGAIMTSPFGASAFLTQMLVDTSDPANHYLYVMTETGGTSSTLYKIALNNYPNAGSIIGSASTTVAQPGLGYGVIDLTNHCAYYGTFIPTTQPPYLAKFALGAAANGPTNLGGISLDTATNRSVGGMALDIANGFGYCASDGNDLLFGHGRVYKWALNGTAAPTLVSYVDMHTNEGYCHVAAIKPQNGLLYFSDDLAYPGHVFRYRLPGGTNAPVETGFLSLLGTTNTVVPAWGSNPTNASNWGEVFARSIAYDPVRDFVYIGRDDADEQLQPYTDQIVKVALDRDETCLALARESSDTNNSIPYQESFSSYTNGFSLIGTNGWSGEDEAMALVVTNQDAYPGIFPSAGAHPWMLQVDGAATNRFNPLANSNVWLDLVLQARYWTDPIWLSPSNTPFAMCISTNGHIAVWNNTNPPAGSNAWTELTDTFIASNQFCRVTVQANYERDTNGWFYYRLWVNGVPSTNPQTWYAAADTNQDYFGDVVAQGRFALDDLVVTPIGPVVSGITVSNGSAMVQCGGLPGLSHRVQFATTLNSPANWQFVSTNVADAKGLWTFTDTNSTSANPSKFYRVSLP